MTVRSDQLRDAAKLLRDRVSAELTAARADIGGDADEAVFGPTVAPAAQEFLTAWRAELSAVVDAVEQLAQSLDQAADDYDRADQAASLEIRAAASRGVS